MKKIILLAGLLFCSNIYSQLITATANGEPISDHETFIVHTTTLAEADLHLLVTNISENPINVKLKVNSIQNNSNGSNVQFCFGGLCYFNIDPGDTVPSQASGVTLQPNETNNVGDHFVNEDPGDNTNEFVKYNLSFIRVDDNGQLMDILLTFNYIYQSTLGTDDLGSLQNLGITVNNTIVKDALNINASQPAAMDIYALDGKLLRSAAIAEGSQSVDLSDLSAAIYIAKFTNKDNQSSTIRVVKN